MKYWLLQLEGLIYVAIVILILLSAIGLIGCKPAHASGYFHCGIPHPPFGCIFGDRDCVCDDDGCHWVYHCND